MSASNVGPSASAAPRRRAVPAPARVVAGRLAALFATDQQIVRQLNDAPATPQGGERPPQRRPPSRPGRGALADPRAFCAYQHASEQRRELAVDVGELAARLTDVLLAAGWSIEQATAANVHHLVTAPGPPAEDHARTRSER